MRQISFFLTTRQFRNRTKTVTRRRGWSSLSPGTRLMAVVKGQGLGKGGKVERLGEIEVVSVRREPLMCIKASDVIAEGFPLLTCREFCEMYCKHNGGDWEQAVTRIEFKYIDAEARPC
jgi:hypothetical protein